MIFPRAVPQHIRQAVRIMQSPRTLFIDRAAAAVWKQRFTDCTGRAGVEKEKEKKKKNEQMKEGNLSFSMTRSCAKAFQRSAFLLVRMNWAWPQPPTKGFTCVFKERGGALRLRPSSSDRRMRRVGTSALYALRRWILNTAWHRHVYVYGIELLPFSHSALLLCFSSGRQTRSNAIIVKFNLLAREKYIHARNSLWIILIFIDIQTLRSHHVFWLMQTSHCSYCQTYLFLDKLTSTLISVKINYLGKKKPQGALEAKC